jgi:hypothetical protein
MKEAIDGPEAVQFLTLPKPDAYGEYDKKQAEPENPFGESAHQSAIFDTCRSLPFI